jgi:hypothetical protein
MYQNVSNITNQFTRDLVPALIEKLSSEEGVKVKIQTDYDNISHQGQKKNLLQIGINFNEEKNSSLNFSNLSRIFSNKRSPNFPSQEQKHLLNKLKHIPCYTVVNDKNEIVMASPRSHKEGNSLEWIQNKYHELLRWSGDKGSVSLSLFFMNKEDAATYLHEICKREPKESEIRGLKIKITGLDTFYKFNRTSPIKNQTRLVCDLQEIDALLKDYIHTSSNIINSKQKYSNHWFQGTPVYSFKASINSRERELFNYSSQIKDGKNLIFFTRKDAIKAWKCYLSRTNQNYYKNTPTLEIYNLESLLLDLENSTLESILDIVLIPPSSCITENKLLETKYTHYKSDDLSKQFFKTKLKLKEFQRFYKGLIWLFTSDTLPSEENSW